MAPGITQILRRMKQVWQKDGLIYLLGRGFRFVSNRILYYRVFYLCRHTLQARNEVDFMPGIRDCNLKVVSTNWQADGLANSGFEDFRHQFFKARQGLDLGAVAFCIYVGKELAHIGWVAMGKEAKETFDGLPYYVGFSAKEACTGGTVTVLKYRGKGLMTYGYYKRLEFLRQKGIITVKNAISENSIASKAVMERFDTEIYARARCLKIIRWGFWRETRLNKNGYNYFGGNPAVS
jgi:hypothetical protein